jgi:hypothetical protein
MICHTEHSRAMVPRLFKLTLLLVMLLAILGTSPEALTQFGVAYAWGPSAGEDAVATAEWPMAGANPQRTSWTSEEVPGPLNPIWYKPIEPYISQRVQIIAANDTLYISTARGLYALDADTGAERWVYPTELPLGHSPTVYKGRVYVGGFDHKLHAIDAFTGQAIWTFSGEKGFQTNPLVVELDERTYIFIGNRDGNMYAVEDKGSVAEQRWKYPTDGPILFSAAFQDETDTIYFASNDSFAYALDARTGAQVWKSDKLPGSGFHSWWPVIYRDWVIFTGSSMYRYNIPPYYDSLRAGDLADVFPDRFTELEGTLVGPVGNEPGDWANGTPTLDVTRITEYYEEKPWRRTVFVLDQQDGQEYTFDYDGDGTAEYIPFLWTGTHGTGNRFPPVVGADGVLYLDNVYRSDPYIASGHITGWKPGSPFVSLPTSRYIAQDEPLAYSAGGNIVYWNHCLDRQAGMFDVSRPNTTFPTVNPNRDSIIFSYYELAAIAPGYNVQFGGAMFYGGLPNGVYGEHGNQNPPIPYKGKVYMHRSNAIIAFDDFSGTATALPMAKVVDVDNADISPPSLEELRLELASEVQKIVDSGEHLRPGWLSTGIFDWNGRELLGDNMVDYWHNSADTIYALIRALPYLSPELASTTRTYIQTQFETYPPYAVDHVGWRDGVDRHDFDYPPDILAAIESDPGPRNEASQFVGWQHPPYVFYAVWKYAEIFGGAQDIFDASKSRFDSIFDYQVSNVSDNTLLMLPYVHNAYIAGYIGYLELNRLLALRASQFSKENIAYHYGSEYGSVMGASRNFVYLVPELADYLRDHALPKVEETLDYYNDLAPYWFMSKAEEHSWEGVIQPLYDLTLFQARARILGEPRNELVKYLDVPAFARGDLYYIQNLIDMIEASPCPVKVAKPTSGDYGDVVTYTLSFFGSDRRLTLTDTLSVYVSTPFNYELTGTSVMPTYDSGQHRLVWSSTSPEDQEVGIRYAVTIATNECRALVNTAELIAEGREPRTDTATIVANPLRIWLPLIFREW